MTLKRFLFNTKLARIFRRQKLLHRKVLELMASKDDAVKAIADLSVEVVNLVAAAQAVESGQVAVVTSADLDGIVAQVQSLGAQVKSSTAALTPKPAA